MERLTFEGSFCDIAQCRELPCPYSGACSQRKVWERLKAYEGTGLTPEEVSALIKDWSDLRTTIGECGGIDRLRELAEADKAGQLVVLPCKVGDIVWANLDEMRHTRKCVIEFVNIGSRVTTIVFSTVDGLREQYGVNPISFGKTVFLTREEAEKALEAMRKGETEHA